MKNLTVILHLLLLLGLNSCSDSYEYWDISKFTFDDKLITDSTEVIVIYSSRGPELKNKKILGEEFMNERTPMVTSDYYIHLLAQVKETRDTINILTTAYNWFEKGDEGKTFLFLSGNDITTQILMKDFDKISEVNNINDLEDKKRTKVSRDSKYDFLANNNFPSIIGRVMIKEK